MFLFHHQNLFKNWDYYSWRFQNFLWKHPPTQMKVWCSLLKIHVAIGALSLRITEKTGLRAQNEPQTIYGETRGELMFCFPFAQSRSLLCFAKLTHTPSEPTVFLDCSPWGTMSDSLSSQVTLAVTAWMLSVVSSSSAPANTLPDIKNEVFIKDCVRMHNKFRSSVTPAASDMLYMVRKLQCLWQKSVKNKGSGLLWVVNAW